MAITLITGANKGLGYETARQLIKAGHTVYIGARDPGRGQTAARELHARFVRLDVTDQPSVDAAAAMIGEAEGHLDVLVNNAGVSGRYLPAPQIGVAEMERVFGTNVFGIVRVTRAFLPLLEASQSPVIVNVGSSLGSVVEPGFTATDLNGNRGHQSVADGAEIIVKMATIAADGPTGTFADRSGTVPW
jgi:NAD(P)-dependent dehydrogenase (short-subunit alcohol dehydrogenase family)